jgi:tyrosyl-tRNA synthetase
MKVKAELARRIVTNFHSAGAAARAADEFSSVVQRKEVPSDIKTVTLQFGLDAILVQVKEPSSDVAELSTRISKGKGLKLVRALVAWAGVKSRAEAARLIKQGAVEIDGKRITDPRFEIDYDVPREFVLRVGKKKKDNYFRVKIS